MIKIAVLNNSGNVGKSTVCTNLLQPRIINSEIVRVESINNDGSNDLKLTGNQFIDIMKRVDLTDNVIIDIGSSNIEIFFNQLEAYKGSEEDIDYFIIPTVPKFKQQVDTIKTIANLLDLGVDKSSIKIVFNQFDETNDINTQFNELLNSEEYKYLKNKKFSLIPDTTLFKSLDDIDYSFIEMINDERDFKSLLRSTDNPDERERYSILRSIKRLATGFNEKLDTAFSALELKEI